MIVFPQSYPVRVRATSGIGTRWTTEGPAETPLTCAIPPEFDGPGAGFSPEELYAHALSNCFVATFKVYAERSRLTFETLNLDAALIVDRGEDGAPWMARIDVQATLTGAGDPDKARRLLEKTAASCLILNSVKTEKRFTFDVA